MVTMPHRWFLPLTLLAVGCGVTSQPPAEVAPTPAADAPKVVATSSVICDLTRQIAAERVHLTCLVPAGVDAHTYQPTPANRQALETAQVVFYNGYDFEPQVEKLIKAAPPQRPAGRSRGTSRSQTPDGNPRPCPRNHKSWGSRS